MFTEGHLRVLNEAVACRIIKNQGKGWLCISISFNFSKKCSIASAVWGLTFWEKEKRERERLYKEYHGEKRRATKKTLDSINAPFVFLEGPPIHPQLVSKSLPPRTWTTRVKVYRNQHPSWKHIYLEKEYQRSKRNKSFDTKVQGGKVFFH